ncbi:MAG TPA: hypothetical protein VNB22_10265, partial [Pyrinomonadaceae bacterium]|nr:hypothetical protein [Pyrinomonadaceae bacterium]
MKKIYSVLILSLFVFASGASAQKARLISEIQGDKNISPHEGEIVRVSGVVTARTRTGFYFQTPDDKVDSNPNTSEGIFVFTKTEPGAEATIGNAVTITGTVTEFKPKADPQSLSVTEISMSKDKDTITVDAKGAALPKPVKLAANDFKPTSIDQIDLLEKYEGMRVTVAEMTVVAPTGGRVNENTGASESDGTFYGVIKGIARPFREPGYDIYDYVMLPDKEKEKMRKETPKLTVFDHNLERIRV